MATPDEAIAALEKKIHDHYAAAVEELNEVIRDYFDKLAVREKEQRALLEAGKITEEQFKQWRLTQYGRGERFIQLRDNLAERMYQANVVAAAYINNDMATLYAMGHAYTIEWVQEELGDLLDGVDFTLLNEEAIRDLIMNDPDLMPYYPEARAIDRNIDLEYGRQQITASVTSSIIQGKSIEQIAANLAERLQNMGEVSARRAARTACGAAVEAGKQAARDELSSKGVMMGKMWDAAWDMRTRPDHAKADGQVVENDKPFKVGGEELMFPKDKSLGASPKNIYNCRCTATDVILGFESILTPEQRAKANIGVTRKHG